MQLRELLKNQQILTPLVSAKNTSSNLEWDAFSQLIAQKSDQSAKVPFNEPYSPQKNDRPKLENDVFTEKKFNVRISKNEIAQVESPEQGVKEAAYKPVEKKSDKSDKIDKNDKNDFDEDKDDSITKEKLKAALRTKLKKATGLDDQQIDTLLASLNLDVIALNTLLSGGEAADDIFTKLTEVVETLEIDQALDQNMNTKDVKHIVEQLDKLIDSLKKLQEISAKSNDMAGDTDIESDNGKAFEMKVIQALSRVVESLNTSESDVEIKPEDVKKAILDAIRPQFTTQVASQKTPEIVADSASENAKSMNATVTTSAIKGVSTQADSSNANASNMNSGNDANAGNTPQTVTPANLNPESQGVGQSNLKINGDAATQTLGDTEPEAPESEAVNGVSMHQVAMKQSNTLVAQTLQPSSQLKQEIFTQIIDAIKGQMKLSDHGTSLIVKLQPEQLGNVELKLNIHKGIVVAEIKVENEIVKATIESHLDDLKQSLTNKGYSVDQINVSVDTGKKNQQEQFEFHSQERKNKHGKKPDELGAVDTVETLNKYVLNEYEGSTINYYG